MPGEPERGIRVLGGDIVEDFEGGVVVSVFGDEFGF
jgi:hypothetical protein